MGSPGRPPGAWPAPPRPPRRPRPPAEREVNFTLACERETSFTFGE
ncbi:hypothetical protein L837_0462 [Mycobacterium avium MAV_061107_1842]|nr:hypothetical protein L837_0462 [Mycobacterium avium MAV_061107_1842]